MKNILFKLHQFFNDSQLNKEAGEVEELLQQMGPEPHAEDYEEPWHQDALNEMNADQFGDEPISEEEYLDQTFTVKKRDIPIKHYESYERKIFLTIAKKEGFHILETGDKSAVAGQGGYGLVLRGTYQGHQAVAKIILGPDGRKEVSNWQTILNASKTSTPNLKTYVPKIYKLNYEDEGYQSDDYDAIDLEKNYGIIIMEELLPINHHLRDKIEAFYSNIEILSDPEYLWEITLPLQQDLYRDFPDLDEHEIMAWLLEIKFQDFQDLSTDEIKKRIIEHVKRKLLKKYPYQDATRRERRNPNGLYKNPNYLEKTLNNLVTPVLPLKYDDHPTSTYYQSMPETQGFITSLIELGQNTGLGWHDLVAPKNIMMDKNGNLKIIDVGIYYQIDDGSPFSDSQF